MSHYDVAVIGGGAAGLSAALVLSRARRRVVVVDAGKPRNAPAAHMHGYLSRDGLPPAELLGFGRAEVESYGAEIVTGSVAELVPDGRDGFGVLLEGGQRLSARRLLVATGLHDVLPDIPDLWDRWGRDVLHCPYCHGHEVRDQQLGVIGSTPAAVRYAQIVRQWTHDLVYFTAPDVLSPVERSQLVARSIGVVEGTIEQLVVDDDRLRGVQMADGGVVPRDALFVPPRFVPNSDLLVGLGCDVDADGWVGVDSTGRTSVPGAWAAGNVVDPRAQIITAAGAGSAAAIALNADLVDEDVRNAVHDSERGSTKPPHAGLQPSTRRNSNITIAHETFGDPSDPAVLLVMGFGTQLLGWDADFCRMLAARGRYVIRYDNRDCGLSTRVDEHPVDLGAFITAVTSGDVDRALAMAPYFLCDMAGDGMDLLTELGIARAHVVGSSMGGMIAQKMAIEFPDRVLSLTSMMSSTGEPEYGQATPEAQQVLFSPRPGDRDGYVAAAERELVWASRRYGDAGRLRALAAASYDRAHYPAGIPRQLAAMILDGSRAEALNILTVPTLVIHGLDDTLIDPSGGRRTAELVPGAQLLLVEDMGHDRPPALWPDLIDALTEHTAVN